MRTRYLIILLALFSMTATSPAFAKDLFVDYENGKDANDGLTRETPWKHAPGDPNAGGNVSRYDLEPGDTIYFKGGVEYLGGITFSAGGSQSNPVTYKGNGWGEAQAIISGAKKLAVDFKPCQSAEDCYGNSNWEKLYKTRIDGEVNPLTPMFLSGKRIWLSREPNQPDPFWFDDYEHYESVGGWGTEMTESSLILGSDLDDTSDENWRNAIIALWMKPNQVVLTDVTGIDRASGTINFDPPGNEPYTDRDSYYALFNRPSDIDQVGEYFVDNDAGVILLWPESADAATGNDLSVNDLPAAFALNGNSNIVIEGFHISRYFGDHDGWQSGTAVINGKSPVRNIIVRDNTIDHLRSVEGVGAIQLDNSADSVISNNVIANSQKSSGIRFNEARNIIVRDNVIDRIGRTGIRLINTENMQISGNQLSNIYGIHGNGMSVYLENRNILIADNILRNVPFAFTYHGTDDVDEANNMWLLNNVILGPVRSWGSQFDKVTYLHNLIFAEDEVGKAVQISGYEPRTTFKNNIIDGMIVKPSATDWTMSHNIYTALAWTQSPKYGWSMEPESDLDDGFVDDIENFSKKRPELDMPIGDNIYGLLPVQLFPQYDFSRWKEAKPIGPSYTAKP